MSRTRFILCCGLLAILATGLASANSIVKIRVDDTIQPITAEYIDRAIEHARQTNADAVLIELSTPGGLLDSTRTIIYDDPGFACSGHHLRCAQRGTSSLGWLLHPRGRRRRGYGSGNKYRSGASRHARGREDG